MTVEVRIPRPTGASIATLELALLLAVASALAVDDASIFNSKPSRRPQRHPAFEQAANHQPGD